MVGDGGEPLDDGRVLVRLDGATFKLRAVRDESVWHLFSGGEYRRFALRDELQGLDDVDPTLEIGLGIGYETRDWRAFTDVRYGIIGHNAWVGEVGADGIAYPVEGLTLTLGPRLSFGTDNFAETYFGVSAEESAASGLDQFTATGGLLGAGMELGARYRFNERWGVEGAATWNRLVNDAGDSPVTATGSDDQYEVRLGITRSVSLDF